MLHPLGVFIARHRFIVLIVWAVVLGAFVATSLGGVAGETLFQRLSSAGPTVKGEASDAEQLLQGTGSTETESLSLLVYGIDLAATEAGGTGATEIVQAAAADLREIHGVTMVANPLESPDRSHRVDPRCPRDALCVQLPDGHRHDRAQRHHGDRPRSVH